MQLVWHIWKFFKRHSGYVNVRGHVVCLASQEANTSIQSLDDGLPLMDAAVANFSAEGCMMCSDERDTLEYFLVALPWAAMTDLALERHGGHHAEHRRLLDGNLYDGGSWPR